MASVFNIVFYVAVFLSVYAQVFFLVTFLENRKKIVIRAGKTKLQKYPMVTIFVPCFNEEKTIYQSVRSLFNLHYPKDKIKIFLINDGSTDGTRNAFKKFSKHPNIKIFHKKNEGKFTALNLGLENAETEFVGCLDADSLVDSEALVRIMSYFEKDQGVMAVAPATTVNNPKGFLGNAQRVEYSMGIYFKKMLGFLGAINVTPGPFTIFRKKVFDDLGPYAYAYNTEDLEIAYRMQKNYYKIENCNDAYVYTNTPRTISELFRQRLRWIYGFINNTIDYRKILLNRKYGNFSLFTLPMGITAIFSVSYAFALLVYNAGNFIFSKIAMYKVVGLEGLSNPSFDLFFINVKISIILAVAAYFFIIFSIMVGRQMTKGTKEKWGFPYQIAFYLVLFSVLTPFWVMKAVYHTIISKTPAWR